MSLVGYNTEHEERRGTSSSILCHVTFTVSCVVCLTQRTSRERNIHTRVIVRENLQRKAREEENNEDVKV
jgi:hypothetical protein